MILMFLDRIRRMKPVVCPLCPEAPGHQTAYCVGGWAFTQSMAPIAVEIEYETVTPSKYIPNSQYIPPV